MATNGKSDDSQRNRAVKKRSQVLNPITNKWVKRDADTDRFIDGYLSKELEKKSNYTKNGLPSLSVEK